MDKVYYMLEDKESEVYGLKLQIPGYLYGLSACSRDMH